MIDRASIHRFMLGPGIEPYLQPEEKTCFKYPSPTKPTPPRRVKQSLFRWSTRSSSIPKDSDHDPFSRLWFWIQTS